MLLLMRNQIKAQFIKKLDNFVRKWEEIGVLNWIDLLFNTECKFKGCKIE
jgi:hypothetical protein